MLNQVTFYITRMDGELHTRETPIYFPAAPVIKGRTLSEDRREESLDVTFIYGRFTCDEGGIQDKWLEIYNSGGILKHEGLADMEIRNNIVIKPSIMLFHVSKNDPLQTKIIETKVVDKIIEKMVIPADIVELLTVDQLEQYAISAGINLGGTQKTKASLTKALKDNGTIIEKK